MIIYIYIYGQSGESCLDIFYFLNDFFEDIIEDSSKNNTTKTYYSSTLQLTLSCCISEFISTCDVLYDKLPYIFCRNITNTRLSEITQGAIQFRNTVLNIFADYIDIKKLIIRHLSQKLDKKKNDINNILKKVQKYHDECNLIEKQIKEYEDMA